MPPPKTVTFVVPPVGAPNPNLDASDTVQAGLKKKYHRDFGVRHTIDEANGQIRLRLSILPAAHVTDPTGETQLPDIDLGEYPFPLGTPIPLREIVAVCRAKIDELSEDER